MCNSQMDLKEKLDEISSNSFDIFLGEFKTCLDKFDPLKEKKIRFNNSIFMTKSLRKANMLKSQLKTKFLKNTNSKETIVQRDTIMKNEKLITDSKNSKFEDISEF